MGWLTLVLLSPAALAASELLVVAPAGDPLPGSVVRLSLAAWDSEGAPPPDEVPRLASPQGEILSVHRTDHAGVWEVSWRAPERGTEGELRVGLGTLPDRTLRIPLGTPAAANFGAAPTLTGRAAGGGVLHVALTGPGLPGPEDLLVAVGEGVVRGVATTEDGLDVSWEPADVRQARVVPLGFQDATRPDSPPVWVTARLRARVPVSVSTDPGTELSVRVSGRIYGPVLADAQGRASTVVDLWPGEQRAEATLSDDLGNVQRTPIVLPGSAEPVLLALAGGEITPGTQPPPVFLRALDGRGQPWTGVMPECRGTGVGALVVRASGEGTWRTELPRGLDDQVQDLRVDCSLPGTAARSILRIPAGRGVPHQVVLRVYPQELTGDFPVAQVHAHVEDLAGDRLPTDGLSLSAGAGELVPQPAQGLRLAADYTANPGVRTDVIEGRWHQPPGAGVPADLELAQAPNGDLLVRALDRHKRPLAGRVVQVRVGESVSEGETDARGWLQVPLAARPVPVAVEAQLGSLVRRALLPPGQGPITRDPAAPDLVASQEIRVQAGRVREVYIDAEPGVLHTGSGETARVTVRLLDRAGQPVRDEVVQLDVDRGEITGLKTLADGTLEAVYAPPQGLATGRVEVRAQGVDGAFAATTSLMLRPRPVRHSLSVVTGVMVGPGPRVSPLVALDYETHFPYVERGLYLRVSTAGWRDRTTVGDADRGGDVELRMELFSLSGAVMGRWERGLWTAWAGGGPQVVPYRLEIRYPGVNPVSGYGVHQPGLVAFAGGGRRFRAGELFGEVRGLGVTAFTQDYGYEGQVGGVAATAGFRLIF